MSDHVYDVPESFGKSALIGARRYAEMYAALA